MKEERKRIRKIETRDRCVQQSRTTVIIDGVEGEGGGGVVFTRVIYQMVYLEPFEI